MELIEQNAMVITTEYLPALVRRVDYKKGRARITLFTKKKTTSILLSSLRLMKGEEKKHLSRVEGHSNLLTVNQDKLIRYIKDHN